MNTKFLRVGITVVVIAAFTFMTSGVAHASVFSHFGKVLGSATSLLNRTQCLNGQVVSMSYSSKTTKGAVAVKYAKSTKKGTKTVRTIVSKTFSLTKKQFDHATNRSIRRGSQVKACFKAGALAWSNTLQGNLLNTSKKGTEPFAPGNEDSGSGGGGGGSSSGT